MFKLLPIISHDVICLTETWLTKEVPVAAFYLTGFDVHTKDREKTGNGILRHAGVVVAIRKEMQRKRINSNLLVQVGKTTCWPQFSQVRYKLVSAFVRLLDATIESISLRTFVSFGSKEFGQMNFYTLCGSLVTLKIAKNRLSCWTCEMK